MIASVPLRTCDQGHGGQVVLDQFELGMEQDRHEVFFFLAAGIIDVEIVHANDLMALFQKTGHDMGTDESGGAGNENFHETNSPSLDKLLFKRQGKTIHHRSLRDHKDTGWKKHFDRIKNPFWGLTKSRILNCTSVVPTGTCGEKAVRFCPQGFMVLKNHSPVVKLCLF